MTPAEATVPLSAMATLTSMFAILPEKLEAPVYAVAFEV